MKRRVFVTGGSRGIGRAIVLRFAKEGAFVSFSYITREDLAKEVVKEIEKLGGKGLAVKMDVSDPRSVQEAYNRISEKVDALDVLVNNAGVLSETGIRDTTLEEWNRTIAVDLTGVFLVTKTFLPLLERGENPAIVNIASLAGQTAGVAGIAYHAAKAGVIGFTRKLALELAPRIRVNAVAPSFIETDMVAPYVDTEEKRKRVASLHPLGRIGRPEDVANVVYFLASEGSSFITGQTISVNGGRFIY